MSHVPTPNSGDVHLPSVSNVKQAAGNAAQAVKDTAGAVTVTLKKAHVPTGEEVKKIVNHGLRKAADKVFNAMLAGSN